MSKERKAGAPYEVLGFEPGKVHERYMRIGDVIIDYHNEDGSFMAHAKGSALEPARYIRKLVLIREAFAPPADKYHLVGFALISPDGRLQLCDIDGDHVPHRVFETTLARSAGEAFKEYVLDYVSFRAGGFREAMGERYHVEAGQSPLPAHGFDRLGFYIHAGGTGWNMTWRKV